MQHFPSTFTEDVVLNFAREIVFSASAATCTVLRSPVGTANRIHSVPQPLGPFSRLPSDRIHSVLQPSRTVNIITSVSQPRSIPQPFRTANPMHSVPLHEFVPYRNRPVPYRTANRIHSVPQPFRPQPFRTKTVNRNYFTLQRLVRFIQRAKPT